MKLSDVVEVVPIKSALGKLTGYRAAFGSYSSSTGFERDGKDRKGAIASLVAAVKRQLTHRYDRAYYACNDGTLLVVYYADGWCYDIVRDGKRSSVCTMNVETFAAARAEAEVFVEQYNERS